MLKKRKLEREKAIMAQQKAAKVEAMTEREKLRRNAGIAKRKQIRDDRLANEKAETSKRHAAIKKEREEEALRTRKAQNETRQKLIDELKEAQQSNKENQEEAEAARQQAKTSAKKRRDGAPTLLELRTSGEFVFSPCAIPSPSLLSMAATTNVLTSTSGCIGIWGEEAGEWAHPQGWASLIDTFNHAYNGDDDLLSALNCELVYGEYNVVFKPLKGDRRIALPPLKDAAGKSVDYTDVVFRTSRPDSSAYPSGELFYRYKTLPNLQRELYYTLQGALNGFAPECLGALLFPAVVAHRKVGGAVQLYGAVYVMRRAASDMNTLFEEQQDSLATKFKERIGSPDYTDAMRRSGRRIALRLLSVVFRQSKMGILSFDAKPGNYVFGYDAKPYAIDFDAAMYSQMTAGVTCGWEPYLLMNLMLLSAHVRCFRHPAIADGWAGALRPLILELLPSARGAQWLFAARIAEHAFREITKDTEAAAKKRLETMVHIYFVKAKKGIVAPFRPDKGEAAPGLTAQLLKYCLHGTTHMKDLPLDSALGDVRAARALAAQQEPVPGGFFMGQVLS